MVKDLQAAVDAVVLANGNKAKAAESLGVPVSTLKGRLAAASSAGITPLVTPPEAKGQVEKLRLQYEDKVRALEAEVRNKTREELTAEAVRKYFFGLAERDLDPPKWVAKAEGAPRGPGVPTIFMSDFHWGEVVNPIEVDGINAFDLDIAHTRLTTLVDKTVHLCRDHMVSPNYPGIVAILGGDMVSGDIHQELAETNEGQTMQHVFDLSENLASGLGRLADEFGQVFVPCTFGNHGRNTQKPRHKGAAYTSFDWQISCILKSHFKTAKDDRVKFYIPAGPDTLYTLMGHTYLLTHGDRMGVKGGDGILGPLGPIARGVKKIKATYSQLGIEVDTVLMGHWHQNIRLPDAIVNNCLKGPDEYAKSMRFPVSPPNQALWWTHPEYGITFESKVFVDEVQQKLDVRDWVTWRGE